MTNFTTTDGVPVVVPDVGLLVVEPTDDQYLGCDVRTKERVFLVDKGVCSTLQWEIRDASGNAVDLSSYVSNSTSNSSTSGMLAGQVIFRFSDATAVNPTIIQLIGYGVDVDNGIVRVDLTEDVVLSAGIFTMDIAITDGTQAILIDHGLISVERTLFGDTTNLIGPPTVREIRMQMRDTMIENHLLDTVEFDNAEIIHSLVRPIRQWNEMPPPLNPISGAVFPYHDHWLKATIANLLKISAIWYERNRLPASHGGVRVDDMSKLESYLTVSKKLEDEWLRFVLTKKVSINAGLAMGSVDSTYSSW